MKTLLLILFTFFLLSCDRHFYGDSIAVEQHPWQLLKIDTFYARGKYRPSAVWYNRFDRLCYIDVDHEFPYPYTVGDYIFNFDRK
jgi:hypothetical protein